MLRYKFLTILMAASSMLTAARLHGEPIQTSQANSQQFVSAADSLATLHPWEKDKLDQANKESWARLKQTATHIMQQDNPSVLMLSLISQYKDQDGFARQELMRALLYTPRVYTSADLPFLKSVLTILSTFHWDIPPTLTKSRYTDFEIRIGLGYKILEAAGRNDVSLTDQSEQDLLKRDPAAWLRKYAP